MTSVEAGSPALRAATHPAAVEPSPPAATFAGVLAAALRPGHAASPGDAASPGEPRHVHRDDDASDAEPVATPACEAAPQPAIAATLFVRAEAIAPMPGTREPGRGEPLSRPRSIAAVAGAPDGAESVNIEPGERFSMVLAPNAPPLVARPSARTNASRLGFEDASAIARSSAAPHNAAEAAPAVLDRDAPGAAYAIEAHAGAGDIAPPRADTAPSAPSPATARPAARRAEPARVPPPQSAAARRIAIAPPVAPALPSTAPASPEVVTSDHRARTVAALASAELPRLRTAPRPPDTPTTAASPTPGTTNAPAVEANGDHAFPARQRARLARPEAPPLNAPAPAAAVAAEPVGVREPVTLLPLDLAAEPEQWTANLGHDLASLAHDAPCSARLRLHPPALGALDVAIDLSGERLDLRLTVETPAAQAILHAGLDELRAAAIGNGLTLDGARVDLAPRGAGGDAHAGDQRREGDARAAPERMAANTGSRAREPVGDAAPPRASRHGGRIDVYA